jgi:hypothetical protein
MAMQPCSQTPHRRTLQGNCGVVHNSRRLGVSFAKTRKDTTTLALFRGDSRSILNYEGGNMLLLIILIILIFGFGYGGYRVGPGWGYYGGGGISLLLTIVLVLLLLRVI